MEIRSVAADEILDALRPIWHYFGAVPVAERAAGVLPFLREGRVHAAYEEGSLVASASAFDLRLTVPGARLPTAGVTLVGVLPTHRRRGALRRLMRAQLDDVHERGEPLAALWASETGIYGRFGYGMASLSAELDLRRVHSAFRAPVEYGGRARLVPREEALAAVSAVYEEVAGATPGMLARPPEWWESRVLADPEHRKEGRGDLNAVVLQRGGRAEGYGLYRVKLGFEHGVSTGVTEVVEAAAVSPGATAALWRFLLDVDWMDRVTAELLPVDHPLLQLLVEPNRMGFRVLDGLWLRLVDVGAALAARSYAGEGELVLEVADAFCPWNEGRFALDGSRTPEPADLGLAVDALAAAYLGGFTFAQLAWAGRVEELRPGGLARADALFRRSRAPWTPEIF